MTCDSVKSRIGCESGPEGWQTIGIVADVDLCVEQPANELVT